MQNNPSVVQRVKVSREQIQPTSKPSFDDEPAGSRTTSQLDTNDVQQLKEILIAKEMEIRLLKKEIHHLKRTQRRSPEKPVFKTVYEQNITSGEKLNSPHHRHNRVYSIGDYRDFSSKLSPVEHYNHGGYKRA